MNTSKFIDIMQWRATHQPDQRAYTFLADGEHEEGALSYAELDQQAKGVASLLQSLGGPGKRILLLYPAGLEFVVAFLGCLYAGDIAVPLNMPRPRSMQRLKAVVTDASSSIVLTTTPFVGKLHRQFAEYEDLADLRLYPTDQLETVGASAWSYSDATPDTLAFLQYTSGTTGKPKGVMVSHGNLTHNLQYMYVALQHTSESKIVTWLPHFHDMGLIYGLLQPLYGGFPCIMMTPSSFVQRPGRWLEAISLYQATSSAAPNFAYDLCVEKVAPEKLSALDLSSWKVAVNGAEPVRWSTIERFSRKFAAYGFSRTTFYPGYGLAETTLQAAGGLVNEPPIRYTVVRSALQRHLVVPVDESEKDALTLVGYARSCLDGQIVIANPEQLVRCRPDEVGEIWISSPSNAQGYWNRPQETAETFSAYLADTQDGPFLRTGDLGFLRGQELFVTGRIKDLIIINGVNYYPQDIEQVVARCHLSINQNGCAAFSIERNGIEQLVVIAELERYNRSASQERPTEEHLVEHSSETLQSIIEICSYAVADQCELPISQMVFVKPKSLPKTTSGKIQRNACRESFLSGALEERCILSSQLAAPEISVVPGDAGDEQAMLDLPRTPVEQILAQIWADVLGLERVGVHQDFFELGGDSTMGMQVVARAAIAGLQTTPWQIFQQQTIARLATVIQRVEPAPDDEPSSALEMNEPLARLGQKDVDKLLQKLSRNVRSTNE